MFKWVYIFWCKIDNKIHLYMMLTTNLLILFCVQIKVRKVKKSQFNAVQTMLERYVIRKIIMQSFHSCNNISSNSHNWSTKKINDMLMLVKDEKIFSEKVDLSMRVVITSDWRICNSLITSIYWNAFITLTMSLSNWWKDIR